MTLKCKDSQCQQSGDCERFNAVPEVDKDKVFFRGTPRTEMGCKWFKNKREVSNDQRRTERVFYVVDGEVLA
jgi:hypothetical protein